MENLPSSMIGAKHQTIIDYDFSLIIKICLEILLRSIMVLYKLPSFVIKILPRF